MPELPEVEYTARQLRASVIGATIRDAEVFWERVIGYPEYEEFLAEIAGRWIEDVRRRGKYLVIDLSGDMLLSIHRRMSGNLLLLPPGWEVDTSLQQRDPVAWSIRGPSFFNRREEQQGKVAVETWPVTESQTSHCRLCFHFEDGRTLLFTDQRKFGRIELWSREREHEAFRGLGPEPLSEEFTVAALKEALAKRRGPIKQVLLAQEVVAGIGNIYADEALYYAALHPLRPANSLTEAEIEVLHQGIVDVLTRGIEHGGTSFSGYRDLQGEAGNNYAHLKAYHKAGSPKFCERCGTLIATMVIAQRTAHFCPGCQKLTEE